MLCGTPGLQTENRVVPCGHRACPGTGASPAMRTGRPGKRPQADRSGQPFRHVLRWPEDAPLRRSSGFSWLLVSMQNDSANPNLIQGTRRSAVSGPPKPAFNAIPTQNHKTIGFAFSNLDNSNRVPCYALASFCKSTHLAKWVRFFESPRDPELASNCKIPLPP